MYYSIKDGKLLTSDAVRVTPGGFPVSNFTSWLSDLTYDSRVGFGWFTNLILSERPGILFHPTYRVDAPADAVLQEWVADEQLPPQRFQLSKLLIRQNLRDLDMEGVLDSLLSSSPAMAADWNDAVTLDSDDPKVTGAFASLVAGGTLSEDDVKQLLENSRSEYQTH